MRKTPGPDQRKRLNASLRMLVEELQPDPDSTGVADRKDDRAEYLQHADQASAQPEVPSAHSWISSWPPVVIAFTVGIFVGIWISTW